MNPHSIERRPSFPLTQTLGSFALILFSLAFAACATTQQSPGSDPGEPRWLEPSPSLRMRIDDEAKRLPWTHGMERIEIIRWFASVGEPAYPTLLAMVRDPRTDVAGSALAALGATHDSRLVEELHKVPWPQGSQSSDLDLERARTLVRLGDWQMLPVLLHGLRSDEVMTRALCHQALVEATHEQFDYDPKGEPAAREAAVQKWESWWKARNQDPLLQAKP